ncbi:MAG: hypothetical protein NXI21_03285 [Alphaproteobacteria bacterium]|nr:hypothetical protein [Alphaproteobacteria bacterium]
MKLFLDNNISPSIARAMEIVVANDGHTARALRDRFPPNISNVDWIGKLAKEGGWVVLSDDHRIYRNPAERAAWRQSGLIGFFLASGWRKMSVREKTGRLLLVFPNLVNAASFLHSGSIAELPIGLHSKIKPFRL